jgi:hypothetical protein
MAATCGWTSGGAAFVRYRFIPRAGEKYLTPDERKALALCNEYGRVGASFNAAASS